MKNIALVVALLGSAVMAPSTASATILLNIVNTPAYVDTPYELTFIAHTAATTISFAGYSQPLYSQVSSIGLFANNAGQSILSSDGRVYRLTRASSGSNAFASALGFYFQGSNPNSYDTYSRAAATVAGSSYTLRFTLSNSFDNESNGFRVDASNATVAAVPEPATWAMMLVGFGMIGATARYRRRAAKVAYAWFSPSLAGVGEEGSLVERSAALFPSLNLSE